MLRRLLPLALVAALASSCSEKKEVPSADVAPEKKGPPSVAETEPNNDSKSAQALSGPSVVKAGFAAGAKADEDWFKVEVTAPTLVRAEVSAVPGTDVTIEFYDAEKNRIARYAAPDGEPATVPNMTCVGACYLKLVPGKKEISGDYTLTMTQAAPGARSEREPNNRYVDAQPLALGGAVDGYLAPGEDEDWFSLAAAALPPDQVLSLTFASPPDVRAELVVARQSDQAPLGTYEAADIGQDIRLRNLSAPAAPETGYFLIVRSSRVAVAGAKGKRLSNAKVAYTLEAKAAPGAPNLETEPNDDPAHATLVDLAVPTRTGFLSPKGDIDWFTFTLAQPSIVRAEVSGVDKVNFVLSAIDPARKNEVKDNELAKSDSGELKEPETLAGVALPAGENFIRVEGAWKKIDERWVKDFENASEPYTLTLAIAPDDGTHEREPNDKADRATPAEVGKEFKGYIHPAKDVDVYKLEIAQTTNVTLLLSGVPKLDLQLTVRDANARNDKGEFEVIGQVDKNKVEAEERLVVPFEPGSYLVEVREKSRETNPAKNYVLSIK